MLKVKVKSFPVFYAGKRYESGSEFTIEDKHMNSELFEKIEEIEENPFKGVKSETLRKALEKAEVVVPENLDRDELIQMFIDKGLTL